MTGPVGTGWDHYVDGANCLAYAAEEERLDGAAKAALLQQRAQVHALLAVAWYLRQMCLTSATSANNGQTTAGQPATQ
jgi:hypothetical protein